MPLPKWADSSNYPRPPESGELSPAEGQQWRWESLRRNPEYVTDWKRAVPSAPRRRVESIEMYDRYRIYPAQNPAIRKLSGHVVLQPIYPRRYGNSRAPSEHAMRLGPGEIALVYDVRAPLADQISRATRALQEEQAKYKRRHPETGVVTRERRELVQRHRWPILLQVVDAVHDLGPERGAFKEIAERLRLCDPKQTSIVRDHYRWGLTMWKWLPYPEEASKT